MECIRDRIRVVVGSNPVGRVNDRQVLPREAPARASLQHQHQHQNAERRPHTRMPRVSERQGPSGWIVQHVGRSGPFISPHGAHSEVWFALRLCQKGLDAPSEGSLLLPVPGWRQAGPLCGVYCARAVCERVGRAGLARTRGRRRERMHAERIACVRTSGLIGRILWDRGYEPRPPGHCSS